MAKLRSNSKRASAATGQWARATERKANTVTSRRTGKSADRRPPRVAKADETFVGETDVTVPVQPRRRGRVPDHPDNAAALDQRRQIVGTDDPKTRTSRGNRGGRAG